MNLGFWGKLIILHIFSIKEKHRNRYSSCEFGHQLSKQEYDRIFDKTSSFYERQAFVDLIRKKWKLTKGYCSKFDKIGKYKEILSLFDKNKKEDIQSKV